MRVAIIVGANTITLTNSTLQKIQYLSTLTSDVQTQINNLNTKSTGMTVHIWWAWQHTIF
jgi:hypothetical protein